MSNSNSININCSPIELCQEDRLRIDILNKALAILTGQMEGINAALVAKGLIETVEVDEPITTDLWDARELHQEAAEAPEPVEQEQTPTATENAQDEPQEGKDEAPTPKYTVEDVRAKAMDLMRAGKRAEAKAIVNEYAKNITDLPADKCDEVMARLIALEGVSV
jgi:hypothetical protein